jgi:hypothetical protein
MRREVKSGRATVFQIKSFYWPSSYRFLFRGMILIHVSGVPGSGKTTLGQKFAALEGVIVVDTDELISDDDQREMMKLDSTGPPEDIHGPYRIAWEGLFTLALVNEFNKAREKGAKLLLFTGILNQLSPPPGSILPMPFIEIEKYFLDPPPPQLLRQFYTRYTKELNDDKQFWMAVATGRYQIPSSRTYMKSMENEKKWHMNHGYTLLGPEAIEQRINQALGLHQAKQNMGWVDRTIQ